MSRPNNREAIAAAAMELFAARSYTEVTVRDIATAAGVSPALVIKLYGSKAELYTEIGPSRMRLIELDLPPEKLGRALVLQILNRRGHRLPDPWVGMVQRIQDAPDAELERTSFREHTVPSIARLIGDTSADRRFASLVTCQLVGLAEGVRVLGLFPEAEVPKADLAAQVAPLIQAQIDAAQIDAARASG
jgi:AcrR family transcriptional regulator